MREVKGTIIPGFVNWLRGFHDRVIAKAAWHKQLPDSVFLRLEFYGESGVLDYTVSLDRVSAAKNDTVTYETIYAELKRNIAEQLLSEFEGKIKDLGPYVDRLLGVTGAIPLGNALGIRDTEEADPDEVAAVMEHNGKQYMFHDGPMQ